MKRAAIRLLLPFLLLAALTGCATARIPEFQAFADAGTAYTQAVNGLITQVGKSAVDANSVKLLQNRALAPVPVSAFQQQDQEMRDHLAELNRIQVQTTLLGDYFQALADLATSSAPQSFASEVQNVATTLGGVTQEVRGTDLAQQTQAASAAAGSVGGLIVKQVQGRELKRELEARKETIAQILQLHQALLAALGSQAEADARFIESITYGQTVVSPFEAGQVTAATQANWMTERYTALSQPVLVQQVGTAAQAARDLQQAWNKLLANDLTAAEVQAITADLAPVLASLDALKQTSGSTGANQP